MMKSGGKKVAVAPPDRAAAKDEVFRQVEAAEDFSFGEKVASVFDDMLDRSVPFYQEMQRMIG